MRLAVNGFGRIGRLVTRILLTQSPEVEIVAINDPAPVETQAYLLKHDSNYGPFDRPVCPCPGGAGRADRLLVGSATIQVGHSRSPEEIAWGELGVDLVVDATGRLRGRADLQRHLAAGARRVLVSAPTRDADATLIYGVNEVDYDPTRHRIVSAGSCTTNAAAALLQTLDRALTVERAFVATIHAFTNSQALVDDARPDLRDGRAATTNIIPSATGAAAALGEVLPRLRGRIDGIAYRVPTPTVSLLNLTVLVEQPISRLDLSDLLGRECASPARRSTLAVSDMPLVSSDARGSSASATVSLPDLRAQGRLLHVAAWYDNEWGYSARLADLARWMEPRPGVTADRAASPGRLAPDALTGAAGRRDLARPGALG
jgi:glyceraldehyde 3-phosphate dehydrogenase